MRGKDFVLVFFISVQNDSLCTVVFVNSTDLQKFCSDQMFTCTLLMLPPGVSTDFDHEC